MSKEETLLPVQSVRRNNPPSPRSSSRTILTLVVLCFTATYVAFRGRNLKEIGHLCGRKPELAPFYSDTNTHNDLCPGGTSHSGYIGLKGDSEGAPKRSFFWLFEAQQDSENAPVILTVGGGPGTSGLANPMFGQSHCKITENRTGVANPNAWSEKYNVLALDHPVGVGFSYGTLVNNSRDAAYEVYDFLTKFYKLYPQFSGNKLVLASGSYGGTYIPHIATVIHEQNFAIAAGKGMPGARHLNLESMMISNPLSDFLSHFRWALQQRCYYTDFFNATVCHDAYEQLPFCLEAAQFAYAQNTVENRAHAMKTCWPVLNYTVEGRSTENIGVKCNGTLEDCAPESVWVGDFLNSNATKHKLGVPEERNFTFISLDVNEEFRKYGDMVGQSHLLYEPLLRAGIRLLHYIGKADANCAWPGVLSTLKLVPSQYQSEFIDAPDVRWADHNATVRVIGPGAGNFTYVLMDNAGHFVTKDEPVLVKEIVTRWIDNVPFM